MGFRTCDVTGKIETMASSDGNAVKMAMPGDDVTCECELIASTPIEKGMRFAMRGDCGIAGPGDSAVHPSHHEPHPRTSFRRQHFSSRPSPVSTWCLARIMAGCRCRVLWLRRGVRAVPLGSALHASSENRRKK